MSGHRYTMNILGCGKAARTVARAWIQAGLVEVQAVCNRSRSSAEDALRFLGQGRPVNSWQEFPRAQLLLMGVPDKAIPPLAAQVAEEGIVHPGMIIFHLSGALDSRVLSPARTCGAYLASLHPAMTFADPDRAVREFHRCWCTLEGDPEATGVLSSLVQAAGAKILTIEPASKLLYHTALVITCNYLVAILEAGLRALEQAGIIGEVAFSVIQPLVEETLRNCWELGTAGALTGPIARGDVEIVSQELQILKGSPQLAEIYRSLGRLTLEIARKQGRLSPQEEASLRRILE